MKKILVLNGSPKGDNSVTLQYLEFARKKIPGFEYTVHHISQPIKRLEKDPVRLKSIAEEIQTADLVIWSTPVYHESVPGQLIRFLELMGEHGLNEAFQGRFAAVIVTSIHFYDHRAVQYLRMISEDLGMRFLDSHTPHMQDLMRPAGQQSLLHWAEDLLASMELPLIQNTLCARPEAYQAPDLSPVVLHDKPVSSHKVTVLYDSQDPHPHPRRLAEHFAAVYPYAVEILDLRESGMQHGCSGCTRCGYQGECRYQDGYEDWYRQAVQDADGIVFTGTIRGRYLSSYWKMFYDRSFFNGHRSNLEGKQIAYLISGPLSQSPLLREELETRPEMGHASLVGIVSDEGEPEQVLESIQALAGRMLRSLEQHRHRPVTFLSVGGTLIFRDFVYLAHPIFREDDRFYRRHGVYDFPQRKWYFRLAGFILRGLLKIPGFRKKFWQMVPAQMNSPQRRVVKKA